MATRSDIFRLSQSPTYISLVQLVNQLASELDRAQAERRALWSLVLGMDSTKNQSYEGERMSQDEVSETPLAVGISPRRPAPELAGPLDLDQLLLEKARTIPDILSELYKSVMRQGTDYGKVPGTQKPSLWKAGAEILTRSLNLSPQNSIIDKIEQTDPERPYFDYTVECRLYGRNGFVGDGIGSCNTRETRYAFRWVYENQVPASLDKSKLATRSGFGKTQYRIP